MALYNAFRSTYGQPEEPILIIDIGAKTSNLLYIEGKRFFTRSIAIGGASVSAAIAKEYNIGFMEAEHQKISNGLVALGGGHTEQMDEAVAALAMVIRNALSRLPAEISRTTNYYRSQHGGSAPRRILLAGGGANLPYTLEFFQEKLNLPVEYFNPVRNVALGKGVDQSVVQREGHLMGELVGLGLRGIGKSEINIDLVPVVVELTRAADRRKPFLVAAAAVLLGGLAIWAVFQNLAGAKAADMQRTVAEQRESISPVKTQIDNLLKNEAALRQVANSYIAAETDHTFWMDVLAEVRGAFASDSVWLTDFEPIHGYNPNLALTAKTPASRAANGKPVIKPEFSSTPFGASSLTDIRIEQAPPPRGQARPAAPAPAEVTANAVRIKGFWRENPKNHNLVSELLKNLRENSSTFRFTSKNEQGADVVLTDEQILDITITGDPVNIGLPFEITLPLARQIPIK
jgi:hypothetical protein